MFVPSLVGWLRHLPMNWLVNWLVPRTELWLGPFNRLAEALGLPRYRSLLDMMAGDLSLVMATPEILGMTRNELASYRPLHAEHFHPPPRYRYGGACFAKLPDPVPEQVPRHFATARTKPYSCPRARKTS